MNIMQTFKTSLVNLRADKTRFVQITLGIIIGVAAMIVVCNIARGLLMQIKTEFEVFTNTTLYLQLAVRENSSKQIGADDLQRLVDEKPELFSAVSPSVVWRGNIRYEDGDWLETDVWGVGESFDTILLDLQVEQGRWLQSMDIEREQRVCIIGKNIAEEIIGGEALGENINIQGETYRVVGILQGFSDEENDSMIIIPYTCALKLHGYDFANVLWPEGAYGQGYYFDIASIDTSAEAIAVIRDRLIELLGRDGSNARWYMDSFNNSKMDAMGTFYKTVLSFGLIICIIMLSGGVGVMNAMLAAVAKRKPEIGIRKAFGATNKDIRRQFVLEAACVCSLGSFIGIALSLPLTWFFCTHMFVEFEFAVWPVVLSVAIAVLIGVIFGYAPAGKAAKMKIVDALNES